MTAPRMMPDAEDVRSVADISPPRRVSSPASTGGAGSTFEQHVGAYWLAQLLVGAVPPILTETTVCEVQFQTERLGWHTDDLLVCCSAGSATHRLAAQVKRSFTVSASDEECVKTIGDFWRDFNNAKFSHAQDRLVLITLRGTNTLLADFVSLLDCARAARTKEEFGQRLATPGLLSKKSANYCDTVCAIVNDIDGANRPPAELWAFLRLLHVLSLDLCSATNQSQAQITSLLALTVADGDPVTGATSTWHALLEESSTARSNGMDRRREDLPSALLSRHSAIGTRERQVLRSLADHTQPVLKAIRSTVGTNLQLPRASLVQQVLDGLENTQVVIVTGPAGSGKSVVAKDAVAALSPDHFVFGFRAEEFAQPHLGATLVAAQTNASWSQLQAILGAQDRKVVLVESVERLLEKTTREAFTDLMTMAADDRGLRIVLTCRDYSTEQVRASFLQAHAIPYTVVRIPPLDDTELGAVAVAYPSLAVPLASAGLRDLLRNPFVLDKATTIAWHDQSSLPRTEREFRLLFWREVVRAGPRVSLDLGLRRGELLQDVAVRRARALSAYVMANDMDPAVIASLRSDGLIVSADANPFLVATGHDVIEDWAILQWLDGLQLGDAMFDSLSHAIGAEPALRRSYRKWMAELVERDPTAAESLFQTTLTNTTIGSHFRDDTLVALLRAPAAPAFVATHEAQLISSNCSLLIRVIRLTRVACIATPDWLGQLAEVGSTCNVPDGAAWPALLGIVHRNLYAFSDKERALLLGFIEDAVAGVTWRTTDLDGATDISSIAHWLLDRFDSYRDGDARARLLKVLAKIPNADPVRFEARLRGQIDETGRRDEVAESLQRLILAGTEGGPAARGVPDVVVSVAAEYLLASEHDIDPMDAYVGHSLDVDLYFGFKDGIRHDAFPASAVRGPWIHLLRAHLTVALDFYMTVLNHSADWYAHPRLHGALESAWEVELTFSDGHTRTQWTNARLWGLYRGASVGPYSLISMLMALEMRLLEIGKIAPARLDAMLVHLLRRCDNAAVAAVVTSVATAFPHAAGEALLVLLSVPDYVALDLGRRVQETSASAIGGILGGVQPEHRIYEEERHKSNALPHRAHDLETAIFMLQLGPLAARVQALIDRHLSALPPQEEQTQEHLRWRLALHRMDGRQYIATEIVPQEGDAGAPPSTDAPPPTVRLELNTPPDADVQAMVSDNAIRMNALNARIRVLMWSHRAFAREVGQFDESLWEEMLATALTIPPDEGRDDGTCHGPGMVAAVCIRDHWGDMASTQREWCVDRVCTEVMRLAAIDDDMESVQRSTMRADRACATVLWMLMHSELNPTQAARVRVTFAAGLTHSVQEVQRYMCASIDASAWQSDPELALRCVNAIASEAASIEDQIAAHRARPRRGGWDLRLIARETAAEIRTRFWQNGAIDDDAHATLDLTSDFGAEALDLILLMFGEAPHHPLTIRAFVRASHTLAGWWTIDSSSGRAQSRNYQVEADVSRRIERVLLRTSPEAARDMLAPLLATVERQSKELALVMQGVTSAQDADPNTPAYWLLWEQFANAITTASWSTRLATDRHPWGNDLLSAVFLTLFWKESTRHWRTLEGHAHRVDALLNALPAAPVVFDNYTRFLYHIGEQSLPGAFLHVADTLARGDASRLLAEANTVFMLEVVLQRHVYGMPLALKKDGRIRKAVLAILDHLVEAGSSAAFRMRDDFVTPNSV